MICSILEASLSPNRPNHSHTRLFVKMRILVSNDTVFTVRGSRRWRKRLSVRRSAYRRPDVEQSSMGHAITAVATAAP